MKNIFIATAKKSKLDFGDNRQRFVEFLQRNEGKKIRIEEQTKTRTGSQNNYMHKLFDYIADETGHSKEEVKTMEKRRHLTPEERKFMGQKQLVLPSTASLSNPEAQEFIERILADCAELGIHVPTAQELGYDPVTRLITK